MRVAITVLIALAALVGPIPALAACSSGSPGGGSSPIPGIPTSIVNPVLELVGLPPLGSSTTNITNTTITNNIFTTTASEQTSQGAATAQTTTPAPSAGGGGGGGGIGGLGGGFSGGSSAGGSPINPSSESSVQMFAAGGGTSGTGSGPSNDDPIVLASMSTTTPGESVGTLPMALFDPSTEPAVAPGIALATAPEPLGGSDDSMTVAMASPTTAAPASGDGFGFESRPSGSRSHASGYAGTTMLAALIGVGMLGAGWAWRSL
jgi:hypothetical protein